MVLSVIRNLLPIILIILGVLLITIEHFLIPYIIMFIGVFYIFDGIYLYKQKKKD